MYGQRTAGRRRMPRSWPIITILSFFAAIPGYCIVTPTQGFALTTTIARPKSSLLSSPLRRCNWPPPSSNRRAACTCNGRSNDGNGYRRRSGTADRSSSQLSAVSEAATAAALSDYAPAAATLFNNMKLPAAVVTAGMISLGFATRFPELPRDALDRVFPREQRQLCAKLDRLHIVLGLVSVTSELIVVLWSAVEVNQLTERAYEPTYAVWDLIHRDCDLAWSAVNSHFILGIIGFVGMLWLRAYVMLLSANASRTLMLAASTGTGAALCLLVSIVNRGVESGGGNSADSYGHNILDLVSHYAALLFQAATHAESPGLLQLSAILLETTSLSCMFVVLLQESEAEFEDRIDEDSCPIDAYDILNGVNGDTELSGLSAQELDKLNTCIVLEDEEELRNTNSQTMAQAMDEEEEARQKLEDSGDYSSVNVV